MSYSLSFSEDFFSGTPDGEIGGDDIHKLYPVTPRPQNVVQALVSMEARQPKEFRAMVKKALGYSLLKGQPADETVFWELLEAVREFDTCDTLTPPISVYVCEGYSVEVYEDIEEEVA
jgi:hypothetical protein